MYILSLSLFVFSYTPLSLYHLLTHIIILIWLRPHSFFKDLSSGILHICVCSYKVYFASFLITLCLSFWHFLCCCYCYFWLTGLINILFRSLSISATSYISLQIERIFKLPGNCTKYSCTRNWGQCVAEGTITFKSPSYKACNSIHDLFVQKVN